MIKRDDIFYFNTFLEFPHLIHGFSTRAFGDMRPSHEGSFDRLKKFANVLKTPPGLPFSGEGHMGIVRMHQVHSSNVRWVTEKDGGNKIEEADGLLNSDAGVFLSVVIADCVPVLLYDPEKKVVGAVHAGWRGVYKEIIKQAVGEMVEKGSNPANIIVGIGPSIGACCYDVTEEHAEMFTTKFPQWDFVIKREGKLFLDLPLLVKYQLLSVGILDTTIEESEICTSDSPADLFSCRREGKEFGEFVGVIGRV